MKVLVISHSSELGGAERSMLDLFDSWQRKHSDLKLHFIVKGPVKEMGKELKNRSWGYTPVVYSAWSRRVPLNRAEDIFRNAYYDTRAVFSIEGVIKKFKPDIVMTNTIVAPWGAFAAKLQGIPHVWFVREFGDLDHGHTMELGREATFSDISYFSDLVVANSLTVKKHISQYMPDQTIATIYTPFDLDKIDRKSKVKIKSPFKYDDSIKLVITGRIAPSKGQADAAIAVGKLVKKGANIELCVVGSKSLQQDDITLIDAIDKYSIKDRVHLVGHQSNPLPYVKLADIGIMASKMEAFGRTTFEYLALGKPVIGANGGATPEIIKDGRNGYIFDIARSGSMAKTIKKYIDSPETIKLHAKNARRTAEAMMKGQHNADALFSRIEEVVRSSKPKPLPNIARVWLGYPSLAQRYIKESHTISLKKIIYIKLRQRVKMRLVAAQKKIQRNLF